MSYRATAIQAAKRASIILASRFGKIKLVTAKGGNPRDIVTEADIAAERAILHTIKSAHPKHNIIAEESGGNYAGHEPVWLIDPLDGTMNYSRGIPCFSVSIALVSQRQIVLGVVANPMTEEIYWSDGINGAYLNGKKIHVSRTKDFSKAFIAAEWWSRTPGYRQRGLKIFSKLGRTNAKLRYLSSTVWSLTQVARGNFDLETCDTTLLDIAAASIIIKGAGGKLTDINGREIRPFDFKLKRIVAANPRLHTQALWLLK